MIIRNFKYYLRVLFLVNKNLLKILILATTFSNLGAMESIPEKDVIKHQLNLPEKTILELNDITERYKEITDNFPKDLMKIFTEEIREYAEAITPETQILVAELSVNDQWICCAFTTPHKDDIETEKAALKAILDNGGIKPSDVIKDFRLVCSSGPGKSKFESPLINEKCDSLARMYRGIKQSEFNNSKETVGKILNGPTLTNIFETTLKLLLTRDDWHKKSITLSSPPHDKKAFNLLAKEKSWSKNIIAMNKHSAGYSMAKYDFCRRILEITKPFFPEALNLMKPLERKDFFLPLMYCSFFLERFNPDEAIKNPFLSKYLDCFRKEEIHNYWSLLAEKIRYDHTPQTGAKNKRKPTYKDI